METRKNLIKGIQTIISSFSAHLGLDAKRNMQVCDDFMNQLNGAFNMIISFRYDEDAEVKRELEEARFKIYNKRLEYWNKFKQSESN